MTDTLRDRNKQVARDAVLDAAERLLCSSDTADFSMRALAAEAGVGFTTPFNHFGNKTAIIRAISARLIERMAARFQTKTKPDGLIDRTFLLADVAVELVLKQPEVHRAVIGSLGVASSTPSAVMPQSQSLWSLVLEGKTSELARDAKPVANQLPEQLALAFRGCLSFWVAGEIGDEQLCGTVRRAVSLVLLGLVSPKHRVRLLTQLAEG
ncbi:TetR/AcrR family transcriptional regulator [Blastopirellula marina]|nr:TetR/AcrR family transcriptional regulator [Blastopirellula marina]